MSRHLLSRRHPRGSRRARGPPRQGGAPSLVLPATRRGAPPRVLHCRTANTSKGIADGYRVPNPRRRRRPRRPGRPRTRFQAPGHGVRRPRRSVAAPRVGRALRAQRHPRLRAPFARRRDALGLAPASHPAVREPAHPARRQPAAARHARGDAHRPRPLGCRRLRDAAAGIPRHPPRPRAAGRGRGVRRAPGARRGRGDPRALRAHPARRRRPLALQALRDRDDQVGLRRAGGERGRGGPAGGARDAPGPRHRRPEHAPARRLGAAARPARRPPARRNPADVPVVPRRLPREPQGAVGRRPGLRRQGRQARRAGRAHPLPARRARCLRPRAGRRRAVRRAAHRARYARWARRA